MDRQSVFDGLKAGMNFYGGLYRGVAAEIGTEKALALHGKQCEVFGTMMGDALRTQLAGKEVTPHAVAQVLAPIEEAFGMTPEVEETPNAVILRNTACPFYDGFKEAGLDHAAIESLCHAATVAEFPALIRAFPHVSARLEFRPAPDQPCVEIYELNR